MPLEPGCHYFVCNMPQEIGFRFNCDGMVMRVVRRVTEEQVIADLGSEKVEERKAKTPGPEYQYWCICKRVETPAFN